MGELGLFIRLAGPVFVGKSLAAQGGQNPLEPARLGRPVAVGPHTGNFADAVAALRDAGALAEVADAAALAAWVGAMLRDPARAAAMGRAGVRRRRAGRVPARRGRRRAAGTGRCARLSSGGATARCRACWRRPPRCMPPSRRGGWRGRAGGRRCR